MAFLELIWQGRPEISLGTKGSSISSRATNHGVPLSRKTGLRLIDWGGRAREGPLGRGLSPQEWGASARGRLFQAGGRLKLLVGGGQEPEAPPSLTYLSL